MSATLSPVTTPVPSTAEPALARLQAQLREAISARQPLQINGHGSKSFLLPAGAATALPVLDATTLSGISSYEPTELVITARAGTPLVELEAALAERGQWLPFEPPRLRTPAGRCGSVGGMVAAGLAGPARASVGNVRDYVLGAVLLNGRAELLRFGGQVMKNVAGYDVSRLLAGSMGALGLICEVSLKVLPQPAAQATLQLALAQPAALALLQRLARRPLPLQASAWRDGRLWLRLAGAAAAVEAACAQIGGERCTPELAAAFWQGLRDQQSWHAEALGAGTWLWRLSLPPQAAVLDLAGEWLIEWHGGLRWLRSTAEPALIRQAAAQAGGHAQLWRQPAGAAPVAPAELPALQRQLHARVKDAFDPHHLLNPGRLLPGL